MPSYGGVAFSRVHEGWHPLPTREQSTEATHIPYTNRDDVQFGGLGNQRLSLDVIFETAAAFASMEAFQATPAAAITARNLVLWGADGTEQTTSGWVLRGIVNPRRGAGIQQQVILATIQLEREVA